MPGTLGHPVSGPPKTATLTYAFACPRCAAKAAGGTYPILEAEWTAVGSDIPTISGEADAPVHCEDCGTHWDVAYEGGSADDWATMLIEECDPPDGWDDDPETDEDLAEEIERAEAEGMPPPPPIPVIRAEFSSATVYLDGPIDVEPPPPDVAELTRLIERQTVRAIHALRAAGAPPPGEREELRP